MKVICYVSSATNPCTLQLTLWQAWLDSYTERAPEATTLKVAKKYPSKQKFPCPKCPKIWNWPWELRRHLMIHFKPQKLNTANR